MTKATPEGYQSVTPLIVFKDARKAIEFYKRAFGAQELFAMPGSDGKGIMHAELLIGTSHIMMGDECPEQSIKSAESIGGSPVNFYIYHENVDAAFEKAVEAGAKVIMPVQEMFWGDRTGNVQDPFGYSWTLATHTRDLTPQEIQQGAQTFFAEIEKK
jgi:uncharacterized glyoxalase superfamily protein PhnB